MALVPMRPLLDAAMKGKFAFGAFNVNSPSHAKAVIEVHEMFRSACILQGSEGANGFMGGNPDFRKATVEEKKVGAKKIADAVKKYGGDSPIPIVLHLDHGKSFESVMAAIDGGYTSVMIDGSSLPLEENIELSRKVVKEAHARGVTVEGELGILKGMEEHVESLIAVYTNPSDVVRFVKETGVDALAISYGTQHGANKGKNVRIRKEIAIATKELFMFEGLDSAIVSHGSSEVPYSVVKIVNELGGKLSDTAGIPVEQIQEVIPYGIAKVNIDTDIRLAITRNTREYFRDNPDAKNDSIVGKIWADMEKVPDKFDPRQYMVSAQNYLVSEEVPNEHFGEIVSLVEQGIKEIVGERIAQLGSVRSMYTVEKKSFEDMKDFYAKKQA